MGWFSSKGKSVCRSSRRPPRAPKRRRSYNLELLEGRRLLSQGLQPVATLPSNIPSNLVSGPDGSLWVGLTPPGSTATIERIAPSGAVTSYHIPRDAAVPDLVFGSLARGPDGNIWFETTGSDPSGNVLFILVGDVTPAGHLNELPPIPVHNNDIYTSTAIVSGPGGDLWLGYTDEGSNLSTLVNKPQESFIVRITPAGQVTTLPISSFGSKSASLESLVAGPDGNLWFTEDTGARTVLGRMSPGGAITRFPTGNLAGGSVANGPGGSLVVYGDSPAGKSEVFRLSTAGKLKPYRVPAAFSYAFARYLGSADGALWFSGQIGDPLKLGEITPRGVATTHSLASLGSGSKTLLDSIVEGASGQTYLSVNTYGKMTLYRVTPSQLPGPRRLGRP